MKMIRSVCGYWMCLRLPESSSWIRKTWKSLVRLRETRWLKVPEFLADLGDLPHLGHGQVSPRPLAEPGRQQHGQQGPRHTLISPSLPTPSYLGWNMTSEIFMQQINKFKAGKCSIYFFPAYISIFLINSAAFVRGLISIQNVLSLC